VQIVSATHAKTQQTPTKPNANANKAPAPKTKPWALSSLQ
jgi:hypothetical protein